jgi:hypothetical protein
MSLTEGSWRDKAKKRKYYKSFYRVQKLTIVIVPQAVVSKNLKPISLLPSEYAGEYAAGIEGRIKWHVDQGHYSTQVLNVHPANIRATQGWIDLRWVPEWSKGTRIPIGLIDESGIIHLLDGHHRADYANLNHKRIRVKLIGPHTKQHEEDYQKIKSKYGE